MTGQIEVNVIGKVDRSFLVRNSPVFHLQLSGHRTQAVPGEGVQVSGVTLIPVRWQQWKRDARRIIVNGGVPVGRIKPLQKFNSVEYWRNRQSE